MNFDKDLDIDAVDESKFEAETVGFFPYWTPEIWCTECERHLETKEVHCPIHPEAPLKGNRFLGTILDVDYDMKQPDPEKRMVRFAVQSMVNMPAQEGPRESPEEVMVKAGDFFNVGDYSGLPLHDFFGVTILATVVGKKRMRDPKKAPMTVFQVKVDPATKKLLDAKRHELAKRAADAQMARRLGAPPVPETKSLNATPSAS